MVIKDAECSECEERIEVEVDGDTVAFTRRCPSCGEVASFVTICNGGTKTLPMGINMSSRDLGDSIQVGGFEAENRDGDRVWAATDKSGRKISDRFGSDYCEDKRDRIRFRRKGPKRLYLDQGDR